MTPEQAEAREERIDIMTVEGMSEDDAEKYVNSRPELYGIVVKESTQDRLF